jgi:hypothetical protein
LRSDSIVISLFIVLCDCLRLDEVRDPGANIRIAMNFASLAI